MCPPSPSLYFPFGAPLESAHPRKETPEAVSLFHQDSQGRSRQRTAGLGVSKDLQRTKARSQYLITKVNGHLILNPSFDTIHLAPSSWEICYSCLIPDSWRSEVIPCCYTTNIFKCLLHIIALYLKVKIKKKKAYPSCLKPEISIPLLHSH